MYLSAIFSPIYVPECNDYVPECNDYVPECNRLLDNTLIVSKLWRFEKD